MPIKNKSRKVTRKSKQKYNLKKNISKKNSFKRTKSRNKLVKYVNRGGEPSSSNNKQVLEPLKIWCGSWNLGHGLDEKQNIKKDNGDKTILDKTEDLLVKEKIEKLLNNNETGNYFSFNDLLIFGFQEVIHHNKVENTLNKIINNLDIDTQWELVGNLNVTSLTASIKGFEITLLIFKKTTTPYHITTTEIQIPLTSMGEHSSTKHLTSTKGGTVIKLDIKRDTSDTSPVFNSITIINVHLPFIEDGQNNTIHALNNIKNKLNEDMKNGNVIFMGDLNARSTLDIGYKKNVKCNPGKLYSFNHKPEEDENNNIEKCNQFYEVIRQLHQMDIEEKMKIYNNISLADCPNCSNCNKKICRNDTCCCRVNDQPDQIDEYTGSIIKQILYKTDSMKEVLKLPFWQDFKERVYDYSEDPINMVPIDIIVSEDATDNKSMVFLPTYKRNPKTGCYEFYKNKTSLFKNVSKKIFYNKLFKKLKTGNNSEYNNLYKNQELPKKNLRLPGFPDRILFKGDDLECLSYQAPPISGNDHYPVTANFNMNMNRE